MGISTSELRSNIYKLLDRVLETGEPLEINRKGRVLRIVPEEVGSRMSRLVRREDFVIGDPDELIHLDWSGEWRP